MPRRRIKGAGGYVFHVMNRGVRRSTLFFKTGDYEAFFRCQREALEYAPTRILSVCAMPNHWHLVLWPERDADLTRFVGRMTHLHAERWQRAHGTRGTGPVYQSRFKAVPVETDDHLLSVLRYVERNAVRAGLAERAEEWPWCSASNWLGTDMPTLHAWPVSRPANWLDIVNTAEKPEALEKLRTAVKKELPVGSDAWCKDTIAALRWLRGARPVGRPREGEKAARG